jgi:hypothetical protein
MSRIIPAMTDGRSFTNFVSNGQYEQLMQHKFGITDELQYRMFLQRNGRMIADESRKLRVTRVKQNTR